MNVVNLQDFEDARQECAWLEYVELAKKAQASHNMSDAIAAGQTYGRFVRLFCSGAPQ